MLKCLSTLLMAAIISPAALSAQDLEMRLDGDRILSISGGTPHSACGIVLGLEAQSVALNGGATLRVQPLLTAVIGRFDSHGEIRLAFELRDGTGTPFEFLAQALSLNEVGEFGSSDLMEVRYDGDRHFEMVAKVVSSPDGTQYAANDIQDGIARDERDS